MTRTAAVAAAATAQAGLDPPTPRCRPRRLTLGQTLSPSSLVQISLLATHRLDACSAAAASCSRPSSGPMSSPRPSSSDIPEGAADAAPAAADADAAPACATASESCSASPAPRSAACHSAPDPAPDKHMLPAVWPLLCCCAAASCCSSAEHSLSISSSQASSSASFGAHP